MAKPPRKKEGEKGLHATSVPIFPDRMPADESRLSRSAHTVIGRSRSHRHAASAL